MFETYAAIIVSLFIIEVLLSVDNALVNATLAEGLPEEKRIRAIRIGILLGAVFRVCALFLVAIIIENIWLKLAGGAYLIYLAIAHLGKRIDEEGKTVRQTKDTFRAVIIQIALADIVFSIDNVISAVSFSENIYIVMLGVGIGVVSMLYITPILSKLVHKYKGMPQAAYAIVGLIGLALFVETLTHTHVPETIKFLCVMSIVVFTIWYEHSPRVRKVTTPCLRAGQYIMAIPLDIFYAIRGIFITIFTKKITQK